MGIFSWDPSGASFELAQVEYSPFKILLKTKDDRWFIKKWFEHHSKIADPRNIIIFDNLSSDLLVLDYYREISETTNIFLYPDNMDSLHRTDNDKLYNGIRQKCDYFCFLDTDEYLNYIDGDGNLVDPGEVGGYIAGAMSCPGDFIAGLWLNNAFKSELSFNMYGKQHFADCLRWGKPIVRSATVPLGNINHNCQIAALGAQPIGETGFVVFHYRDLIPEQRIAANLKKLMAFGLISENSVLADVLEADFSDQKVGNPEAWVGEIRHLQKIAENAPVDGRIRLENQKVVASDAETADILEIFLKEPHAALELAAFGRV